ncbi:MAG: helix-turn-helix transcriptional regulator [Nanoarchaeales archaeon]|nr:helix-turn-helix transcriptional regulator [Nanoarchaeales archaeon]
MNTQFKKGVLEIAVLHVLKLNDSYGYELVSNISKKIEITEGTLYTILKRFRDDKLVETYLKESTDGPTRKYYKLTKIGKEAYKHQYMEWKYFVHEMNDFLEIK